MKRVKILNCMVLFCAIMVLQGCATRQMTPQLYTTVREIDSDLITKRPEWRVGDTWTYRVSRDGKVHYYTITVVDDNTVLDGNSCYKLEYVEYKEFPLKGERNRHWQFFCKDHLSYLGKQRNSSIEKPKYSPITLCFPLKNDLKWSHTHYQPNLILKVSVLYKTKAEEIEGPKGKISTFKIKREFLLIDENTIDPNYIELWFAPDYKYFAKIIVHNTIEGWTRITELLHHQSADKKN